ncbi:MAG: phasin [Beijerinckiaceae bacterium]
MSNKFPSFEIPTEMRDFAEKSVEQAKKAFDGFVGAANKALDSVSGSSNTVQSGAVDLTRKAINTAEENMNASFEHAQRLVRAKDPQEVMQLQAEFLREQFNKFQSQMKEFGSNVQQTMQSAANTAKKK